jgi:hypothetical protein
VSQWRLHQLRGSWQDGDGGMANGLYTTLTSCFIQHTFMSLLEMVDQGGGLSMVLSMSEWRDANWELVGGNGDGGAPFGCKRSAAAAWQWMSSYGPGF